MNTSRIFEIGSPSEFNSLALETYSYQFQNNPIYREFCTHLGKTPKRVYTITDIPFLPIQFFKTKRIYFDEQPPEAVFTSSGTTGMSTSNHYVRDLSIYKSSFRLGFTHFYGDIRDYCILALLPSYLEREGSSLIY
ncbi:MAG: acyl transferase, partial [Muriicola sp.]|nr:acyl transferase [Muriicola sp.]